MEVQNNAGRVDQDMQVAPVWFTGGGPNEDLVPGERPVAHGIAELGFKICRARLTQDDDRILAERRNDGLFTCVREVGAPATRSSE